ncbi:MAG: SPOR domain-containing protein [Comamonas sp.]|nr:SPOR domain-containing protein [Comamonas sp.]
MAFFKFRWPGQKEEAERPSSRRSSRNAQGDSVESLRRRARHRLIGAAVLVLVGVVGFPLLFDTQPRPIAVDVPIEIPDRNQVAPMVVPGEHTTMAANPRATTPATPAPEPTAPVRTENSLGAGEEVFAPAVPVPPQPQLAPKPEPKPEVKKPEPKPEPKPEVKKPEPKVEHKPEPKVEAKPEPKPEPKKSRDDDAERARALLEGRPASTAAAKPEAAAKQEGKFIVQVGAFGDVDKANEVRQKLAGAGLKAYTQTVNAAAGKVTRVRVGPFNGRAEADKAASRIKGLGLPASVQPG